MDFANSGRAATPSLIFWNMTSVFNPTPLVEVLVVVAGGFVVVSMTSLRSTKAPEIRTKKCSEFSLFIAHE